VNTSLRWGRKLRAALSFAGALKREGFSAAGCVPPNNAPPAIDEPPGLSPAAWDRFMRENRSVNFDMQPPLDRKKHLWTPIYGENR
ncbi:MAG: hypothetical protein C0394_12475, partial [Syntrophus sp. (in: bacteria)]|nr:hypothetical protein [Syntrophus sp. (in: bacteria)]